MRAFFAVELPEGVHATLSRAISELHRRLPSARWVKPAALHITMRFLGERSEEVLRAAGDAVAGELAALGPATVALGGGGFFPDGRRPRVAWLGGSSAGLVTWGEAVERGVTAAGIEPESRRFSLHVTLARLERSWGAGEMDTFMTVLGKLPLATFVAREVVLFKSDLTPAGAVYTPLRRLPAGG